MNNHGSIEAQHIEPEGSLLGIWFPWLNNHGSIEALTLLPSQKVLLVFPWLNNHGSIEACVENLTNSQTINFHDWIIMALLKLRIQIFIVGIHPVGFPWLNNHGSIEAIVNASSSNSFNGVSMIE